MKNIYCVVGVSGSGKTTLAELLEGKYGLKTVQSYTTRPQRYEGETGHIFVNKEEFDALGEMCAYTNFAGNEYGVTADLVDASDTYVIDVAGVKYLKEKYHGKKNINTITLRCSETVVRNRMAARGDSEEKINERIEHDALAFMDIDDVADVSFDVTLLTPEDLTDKVFEYILRQEGFAGNYSFMTNCMEYSRLNYNICRVTRFLNDDKRDRADVGDMFEVQFRSGEKIHAFPDELKEASDVIFRGQTRRFGEKVKLNGEPVPSNWVYGGIFKGVGDFSIIYQYDDIDKMTVYSDTVSEFTGAYFNNIEAFEGDIVACTNRIGVIVKDNLKHRWVVQTSPKTQLALFCLKEDNTRNWRIVGNKWDNPELLRGILNE